MTNVMCTDNRFEVIAKAKEKIVSSTNIENSPKEMEVLDDILFRMWQCDFLDNGWHTGTPTEDGWYLTCCEVLYNGKTEEVYEVVHWGCGLWGSRRCTRKIVAWQKIEPYRG